jgi:hypothetical protein
MFLQDRVTSERAQERREASINSRAISEPKRSAQASLERKRFGSDIERLHVEAFGSLLRIAAVLAHQLSKRCATSNSCGNGPDQRKVLVTWRGWRAVPLVSKNA